MASFPESITVDMNVEVTKLNLPLMIIVEDNNKVRVFEKGEEVINVRSVTFNASVDALPLISIERIFVPRKKTPKEISEEINEMFGFDKE